MATVEKHRNRPAWHRWYGLAIWQKRRASQLKKQPLCEMCKESGIVTIATVANHVTPHKGNERLFFEGELNSLCENHHNSSVAQIERHGFIREIGIDGWPVDIANHPVYVAERKHLRRKGTNRR
jgi:5-methylcytosine-specific restriction enzyme A